MNEVQMLQKLSQVPGIVRLQGIFEDGREFWTVLELCVGGRLEPWLQRFPDSVLGVTKQLVDAVKRLHSMLICHLDLKPDNVLLTESGSVRLIDFITSCQLGAANQQLAGNCGTEGFKAPEVTSGCAYSGLSADVFSLGRTLRAVSEADPSWRELTKVCREMTIEMPSKRPRVADVYAMLFKTGGGGKGSPVPIDFASLDTVSSRHASDAVPQVDVHVPPQRRSQSMPPQSVAQPPEIRSRWNKATERSCSVEAAELKEPKFLGAQMYMRPNQQEVARRLPQSAAVPKSVPAAKGPVTSKRAPACGSATCARVGLCLCADRPPPVVGTPQQRSGALRRCNTP